MKRLTLICLAACALLGCGVSDAKFNAAVEAAKIEADETRRLSRRAEQPRRDVVDKYFAEWTEKYPDSDLTLYEMNNIWYNHGIFENEVEQRDKDLFDRMIAEIEDLPETQAWAEQNRRSWDADVKVTRMRSWR